MDIEDRRDLVRELFVLATERLEDGHLAAAAGQGEGPDETYVDHARALIDHADEITLIARTILAALGEGRQRAGSN